MWAAAPTSYLSVNTREHVQGLHVDAARLPRVEISEAGECTQAAAAQHRADQTARDLQEAHIARMAAENKLAEMQVRQNTASTNFSQQVLQPTL